MRRLSSALLILAGAMTFVFAIGGGAAQGQIPLLTTTTTGLTLPLIGEVTVPTLVTTTTVAPASDPVTVPTLPPVTTVSSIVGSTVSTVTSIVNGVVSSAPTVPVVGDVDDVVNGVVDCASFATQTAAQTAMKLDPSLAAVLDSDRDGAACEYLPVTLPGTNPGSGGGGTGTGTGTGGTGVLSGSSGPAGASGAGSAFGTSSFGGGTPGEASGSSSFGSERARAGGAYSGPAGTRGVEFSQEPLVGANAAAASPLPGMDDDGVRYLVWKAIAFALLLGVTAAAAANREALVAAP